MPKTCPRLWARHWFESMSINVMLEALLLCWLFQRWFKPSRISCKKHFQRSESLLLPLKEDIALDPLLSPLLGWIWYSQNSISCHCGYFYKSVKETHKTNKGLNARKFQWVTSWVWSTPWNFTSFLLHQSSSTLASLYFFQRLVLVCDQFIVA